MTDDPALPSVNEQWSQCTTAILLPHCCRRMKFVLHRSRKREEKFSVMGVYSLEEKCGNSYSSFSNAPPTANGRTCGSIRFHEYLHISISVRTISQLCVIVYTFSLSDYFRLLSVLGTFHATFYREVGCKRRLRRGIVPPSFCDAIGGAIGRGSDLRLLRTTIRRHPRAHHLQISFMISSLSMHLIVKRKEASVLFLVFIYIYKRDAFDRTRKKVCIHTSGSVK